jgi:hypothetical protein
MNPMGTTRNVSAIFAKTLRLRINNGNRTVFRQLRRVRSAGSLMSNKRNVSAANLPQRPRRAKTLQLRINKQSSTNPRQLRRMIVGTLKDGYLRKVPLPRAPLRQSPAIAAVATDSQIPDRQIANLVPVYSQVPRVPTSSELTHSLFGGLGARLLRAPLLM